MVYEFCGWLCSNINGTSGSSFADKKQRSTVGKWAEAIVAALLRVGAKIVILEMLSVSRNRDTERQRFRRNTLLGAIPDWQGFDGDLRPGCFERIKHRMVDGIGGATGKPQHRSRMLDTVGARHKALLDKELYVRIECLGYDEMGRIDHECLRQPSHRDIISGFVGEVKKQIVIVNPLSPHDIRNNPVLRGVEKDPALMDRVIFVAARNAPEIIVVDARDLLCEIPVRLPALYLEPGVAPRVARLILLIDLHRVVVARAAKKRAPIRRARSVIDIAAGIDDQRPAIRRHLETQQIKMAVVPPAERTAIEHQVALVLKRLQAVSPAAA